LKTNAEHAVVGGRYVLEQELGRSSLGIVWRASDSVLDRTVTVHILDAADAKDPEASRRFGEAARAGAMASHPAVLRVLDVAEDGPAIFLVTEYVEGESLRARLARLGPLEPAEACRLGLLALDALAACESVGVRPRVDAEHVLLAGEGGPRLTEILIDAPHEPVDISREAAALVYEALTARSPEPEFPTPPRAFRPGIPRPVDAAVMAALAAASPSTESEMDAPGMDAPGVPGFRAALEPFARAVDARHGPGETALIFEPSGSRGRGIRVWILVPIVLAALAAAGIIVGLAFGTLRIGGPLGITVRHEITTPTPQPKPVLIPIVSVTDFDPFGDQGENGSHAHESIDGNPETAWQSENYFDGELHKPGVGLLFDLGRVRTVTAFRLLTPDPGFEFRVIVGNDPEAMADARGRIFTAESETRASLGSERGRYVLVWAMTVVPLQDGSHRAVVAEFKAFGPGG